MTNIQKIIIPGILFAILGGTIMFFLAFSYYPQKHVNINFDGTCYELLENAYEDYKILEMNREIETKKLQIMAINDKNALIPISYSGTTKEVNDFLKEYDVFVKSHQTIGGNNSGIDKIIIKGTILNNDLEKILNKDVNSTFSKETIASRIGIEPNPYVSSYESQQISQKIQEFMEYNLKNIIMKGEGVKPAECRNNIS